MVHLASLKQLILLVIDPIDVLLSHLTFGPFTNLHATMSPALVASFSTSAAKDRSSLSQVQVATLHAVENIDLGAMLQLLPAVTHLHLSGYSADQLYHLVETAPHLQQLRLSKCSNVDDLPDSLPSTLRRLQGIHGHRLGKLILSDDVPRACADLQAYANVGSDKEPDDKESSKGYNLDPH